MTRGKLLFMFAGLCVVAILLGIAEILQKSAPAMRAEPSATRPGLSTSTDSGDFYVAGHVHHPGMFSIRPPETIKTAITVAGGPNAPAEDLVVRVMRKRQGVTATHSMPLREVLSGQTDEEVRVGDVIDVVREAKPTTVNVSPAPEPLPGSPDVAQ